MLTLREFAHENAKLAKEIAGANQIPLNDAIRIVDMSLGYDLAMQSETEKHLTDLITRLLDEDDAAISTEETDDK